MLASLTRQPWRTNLLAERSPRGILRLCEPSGKFFIWYIVKWERHVTMTPHKSTKEIPTHLLFYIVHCRVFLRFNQINLKIDPTTFTPPWCADTSNTSFREPCGVLTNEIALVTSQWLMKASCFLLDGRSKTPHISWGCRTFSYLPDNPYCNICHAMHNSSRKAWHRYSPPDLLLSYYVLSLDLLVNIHQHRFTGSSQSPTGIQPWHTVA